MAKMGAARQAVYLLFHPNQLRSIIQWKVWHDPVHTRDTSKETPTERSCFEFLNRTSRSFAAVIQELNPELMLPVALFYLVLRGLDTIEDDMTIDIDTKEPYLRDFHKYMGIDGWTFDGNGPDEKDRDLLVHFDDVIVELKKVKKPYYDIIEAITKEMGKGMAYYVRNAENNTDVIQTIKQYEEYCHYVAGLVGEGLTQLFVEAKLANPQLLKRMDLSESMGQFLQKTNIIRDVHEDYLQKRRFWPKEIWSKHVDDWDDLFLPENRTKALECSSNMVLDALKHADECLFYMAGIRDQSVFNFVAIPQTMAIATLELVFRNPAIFDSHIKITKGDACQLMLESTQNLRIVCDVFRRYARKIHKKNDPRDPNFLAISARCAKIEQFIETLFPSQDPKQVEMERSGDKKAIAQGKKQDGMDTTEAMFLMLAVVTVLFFVGGLMVGTAWLMGARFDLVFEDIKSRLSGSGGISLSGTPVPTAGHDEL